MSSATLEARTAPGYTVTPVAPHVDRHSIHTYYNTSPESPDGRFVLYYTSATREGHEGDLRVLNRETGAESIIADGIVTEDAHRVAVQQWVCGGRKILFQNLCNGRWEVLVHNLATGENRVLIRDRQPGFGTVEGSLVPLGGLHWDANSPRDMALLDVETGELHPGVTAASVRETYPEWIGQVFGDRAISVTAGMLSPDGRRVIFKVAAPFGGEMRNAGASKREGMFGYDLHERRFLFFLEKWGHPCWMPDSRHILNVRGEIIDAEGGSVRVLPEWPSICASHPSPSPNGRRYVTDAGWHHMDDPRIWHIYIGGLENGAAEEVHQFSQGKGAESWRPPHAHPVFSPDSERVYFNSLDGEFTRLCAVERRVING